MEHIIELSAILQIFFSWGKPRCDCLSQIIVSLFSTRTVNLSIVANAFVGEAKSESCYKRIMRFLCFLKPGKFLKNKLGELVLNVLGLKNKKVHLAMDRTCWKFGKRHINFLVLTVNYFNFGVPVYFKLLPKKTKMEIQTPLKEFLY